MPDNLPLIQITGDGSPTLYSPFFQASYHSRHGAIQESLHVFIEAGLLYILAQHPPDMPIHVLEMGLGTGLNAFLTRMQTRGRCPVVYTAFETHPLPPELGASLPYPTSFGTEETTFWADMHYADWDKPIPIRTDFTLIKRNTDITTALLPQGQHLIYYDAFGPETQPELWTTSALEHVCQTLLPGGALVTYCAKGEVRRSLTGLGLQVERLPGPPGKREMLRAIRNHEQGH